jgi:hypothetical protein
MYSNTEIIRMCVHCQFDDRVHIVGTYVSKFESVYCRGKGLYIPVCTVHRVDCFL